MTSPVIGAISWALFGAAMLHVIVTDLRHRRISNWLVAALAAIWPPLALAAGVPAAEMMTATAAALLVFAAGFGCFAAGWIGGGDVKLAAVAALWLGAGQTPGFLLLASLLGAALTLALLLAGACRSLCGLTAPGFADRSRSRSVPYGPALAAAALALLPGSPLASAL